MNPKELLESCLKLIVFLILTQRPGGLVFIVSTYIFIIPFYNQALDDSEGGPRISELDLESSSTVNMLDPKSKANRAYYDNFNF